jgi:hypothetical protein
MAKLYYYIIVLTDGIIIQSYDLNYISEMINIYILNQTEPYKFINKGCLFNYINTKRFPKYIISIQRSLLRLMYEPTLKIQFIKDDVISLVKMRSTNNEILDEFKSKFFKNIN